MTTEDYRPLAASDTAGDVGSGTSNLAAPAADPTAPAPVGPSSTGPAAPAAGSAASAPSGPSSTSNLAAPAPSHAIRAALICHARVMGLSCLWFLGIVTALLLLFSGVFGAFNITLFNSTPAPPAMLANASCVYLFVMGIVMSSYLETLLNFGITRRQCALALLAASALNAAVLAFISGLATIAYTGFDPLRMLNLLLICWYNYLLGWLIATGYQHRRVITAFCTTLVGATLSSTLPVLYINPVPQMIVVNEAAVSTWTLLPLTQGDLIAIWSGMALCLLVCVTLAAVILALTRRIAIKI
ncbi:MAG: hypothetical protein LBP28_00495 [Coriobacteriales bacterium]|jgi:hypothetical protein|nr:hypothetical protein [Coriobacteriales bacterium]